MGTKVADIDFGPALTTLPISFANEVKTLTNVTFAANGLQTVEHHAFYNCTALRRVEPFLPDTVTSVGYCAFYNCPIAGKFRVGYGETLALGGDPSHSEGKQLMGTKVEDVDLGPALTQLPIGFAYEVKTLTNVTFVANEPLTIGNNAFYNCTALRRINPLLPDTVVNVGSYAFQNCPIEGTLRIGFGASLTLGVAAYNVGGQFIGARIQELVGGPALTTLPRAFISSDTALTNADFSASLNLATVGQSAFDGDSALVQCTFHGCPMFDSSAFNNTAADLKSRFFFLKTSRAWANYIDGLGTSFKYWDKDVTAAESNTYYSAFADRIEPRGYATVSGRKKWFVPYSDGEEGKVTLMMLGEPYDLGSVTPAYGELGVQELPVACAVSQHGEKGGVAYESYGYRTEKMGETDWESVETVFGCRTFDYSPEPGEYSVVWLWRPVAYQLNLTEPDPELGHVEMTGTVLEAPTLTGTYYVSNTVVTLTVTSEPGQAFLRWFGDVETDEAESPTIRITMDRVKSVTPAFAQPWTFDSKANTLSDGYWTLNTSGSAGALTIKSVKSADSQMSLLDFQKSLGGCTITAIANSAFSGRTVLAEVRLPETLTTIGDNAFSGCTALRRIEPFLPDTVVDVGSYAFQNCPVAGTLRIGFGDSLMLRTGAYSVGAQFMGTRIQELVGGPALTTLPRTFISNDTALTNVDFSASSNLTTVGLNAFDGCTALKRIEPLLPDSVVNVDSYAFQNCPIEGTLRIGFGASLTLGVAAYNVGGQFIGARIQELVGGPALTTLPRAFISSDTALTNADFSASTNLATVGQSVFDGDSALIEVRFNSYPSFGTYPFLSVPSKARFFLSREATKWDAWIANAANATAWTNLTPAAQKVYDDVWGVSSKRPKARVIKANTPFPKDSWLLRYTATTGMKLLFR